MFAFVMRLLFAVNCLMLFAGSVTAAAMIKVDSVDFDIGIIKEGEQKSIKHTFIAKNTGDATLKIEKVKAGCGCTVVEYDSIILPGREGKITQEINLGGINPGRVQKYITVFSNAKNKPELRLSLSCTIRGELEVSPMYLSLTPDKNGMIRQTLTLATQKKDLQITEFVFKEHEKPENSEAGKWQVLLPLKFTTELTKIDTLLPDGYIKYQLNVSLPIKDNKILYGSFTLATNHPKKKEVTLNGVIYEQEK